ncbi:MAG: hypothetical protein JWL95_839 [Gemmatimonadetes bacterium]|nr:hypothetical protein [Gemmatimonadota bacterium]
MSLATPITPPGPTHAPSVSPPVSTARSVADRRFERVALVCFSVFVAVLSALHEPWKDETQTWRLAIDSDGVRALVWNARYEGHPLLFHLMLQALGHLSRSWWAAVALHVVIACAAAWVVLRYAPFSRLEKALVVAGYFPAYEFAAIVRPYGLGMLFAFASCAAWSARRRRPVLTIVLLILLANTSVFGMLLALAAGAAFLIDWIWPDDAPPRIAARELAMGALCAMLALAVVWLVAKQVVPPADASYRGSGPAAAGHVTLWQFSAGLLVPLRAMVPLGKIGEGTAQWNRWLLEPQSRAALVGEMLLAAAIVLIGCIICARRRMALLFFLASTLGLVAFFELFVEGASRHHGHVVIAWIMAAWLSRAGPPTVWPASLRPLFDRAQRLSPRLFTLSLVPMVLATAEFSVSEVLRPFSDARGTADFIRASGLRDAPLIGISRSDAQPVGALLDRPMNFPSEGRTSTFVLWGAAPSDLPTGKQIDAVTDSVLRQSCRAVLVSIQQKNPPSDIASRAKLIYETAYRPMSKDRYRVWLLSAPPSPRCPASPGSGPAR